MWTREECTKLLARHFPEGDFRMVDADYACEAAGYDRHQATGLWGALRRFHLIEKTDRTIGRAANRVYWRRTVPQPLVVTGNGYPGGRGTVVVETAEELLAAVRGYLTKPGCTVTVTRCTKTRDFSRRGAGPE